MLSQLKCIITASTLLLCTNVHAYTINSNNPNMLGWAPTTLMVNVNLAHCPEDIDMRAVMLQAMRGWNSIPGVSIKLALGQLSSTSTALATSGSASDTPLLICSNTFTTDSAADGNTVPGLTGIAVNTGTNRIVYGYTLLNTQPNTLDDINKLDVRLLTVVVAHEFGHLLGLGHSSDPNALMYYDVTGKVKPTLSADDIAGIHFLYNPERQAADAPTGCGTIERTKGERGSGKEGAYSRGVTQFSELVFLCAFGLWWLRRKPSSCLDPKEMLINS